MCRSKLFYVFFFKQKTAYEIKECDWSSDVCSSDLKKIEGILNDYDFEISYAQIRNICAKFGDKEQEEDKKDEKEIKEINPHI